MVRLIDADKIKYTSIAHLASYPVAPSPCDTVMRAEINAMPTVDAKPVRHGKWIGGDLGYCTACGHEGCASDIWDGCTGMYCPNCGAKMDGGEE